MNHFIRIFYAFFFSFFLFPLDSIAQQESFPAGVIFQETVNKNTGLTYQVYIPNLEDNQPAPILIIFDPAGRAELAIEKFIEAAEATNTILFCADQSRNGPYAENLKIFEAMDEDIENKFDFNPAKQFLAGFSGGSRLATYISVRKRKFNGVIACGAGFPEDPSYQPSVISDFGYCGIVGIKDMNYAEMLQVEDRLSALKFDQYFVFPDIGHDWPSSNELANALVWQLARIAQKSADTSRTYTQQFLPIAQAQLNKFNDNQQFIECQNLKESIDLVFPEMEQKLLYPEINSKLLDEQILIRKNTIEKEQELIQVYYKEYETGMYKVLNYKPNSWWKEEVNKWSAIEKDAALPQSSQASRMKNFISSLFYQRFHTQLESGDYGHAEWTAKVLLSFSEQKAYPYFLQAKLAAVQGENKIAEKKLTQAVKEGFSEKSYLLDDPAFKDLQDRKGFIKILESME